MFWIIMLIIFVSILIITGLLIFLQDRDIKFIDFIMDNMLVNNIVSALCIISLFMSIFSLISFAAGYYVAAEYKESEYDIYNMYEEYNDLQRKDLTCEIFIKYIDEDEESYLQIKKPNITKDDRRCIVILYTNNYDYIDDGISKRNKKR